MEPSENETRAKSIVRRYTYGSIAPSLIPVPVLDAAIISGIQLKMLHSLCQLYEVEFSSELGRSMITSLVGGGGSLLLASGSARFLKAVPVIGQIGGMISMAAFGGASTYAVGNVFVQHLETGGTLLTFDADKVRDFYKKEFNQGTQVVRECFSERKP